MKPTKKPQNTSSAKEEPRLDALLGDSILDFSAVAAAAIHRASVSLEVFGLPLATAGSDAPGPPLAGQAALTGFAMVAEEAFARGPTFAFETIDAGLVPPFLQLEPVVSATPPAGEFPGG